MIDGVVSQGGRISFNLEGLDPQAILGGQQGGWTAQELQYIMSNSDLRGITQFYSEPGVPTEPPW